jgi:4-amino-4-deoxy-L-arabinose transferase-like glycosyltransferase
MSALAPARQAPKWAVACLLMILAFDVAWRWHTIGPTPVSRAFEGWLVRSGETEPLDCDEAAYAYMARRMLRGDVLYRDLIENKPPLGYWLYTLAVALGGANEMTVRIMAMPYVLATIGLVWWIGLRLGGPAAACLAALVYAIASADPYVFGNGSNMEHFLNFFSVASLALMLGAVGRRSPRMVFAAGIAVGLASLVKQVAAVQLILYAGCLALPRVSGSLRQRAGEVIALVLGFAAPWSVALGVLLAQGAGPAAYEGMVTFARATATDVPPAPNSPPWLVRLVTGNADPEGKLPPPFGATNYYVWWAAGLWPLWLGSVPATIWLFFPMRTPGDREFETLEIMSRRLVAAWTISAWLQVLMPGQFWPHYYLLPLPGVALAVSVALVDAIRGFRQRPVPLGIVALVLLGAMGWSMRIQARDYLGRTPDEITSEFKGGKQWVALRSLGRQIAERSKVWEQPRLHVWGWQSPLYIYSGLDGASRHFFANELLKAHAADEHPLVRRWLEETVRELRARPPALIFAGHPPFPALRQFLNERYLPSIREGASPDGRGLWIEKDRYGDYLKPPPARLTPR